MHGVASAALWRLLHHSITSSHQHCLLVSQVHGNRSTAGHGPDTYAQRPPALTPPFSYCEEFSSARPAGVEADGSPFRLGQPLVSFSPPFEAPCVDPRGHGGALGEGISGVGTGESPSLDPDAKLHHGSEVTCTVPRASLGLLGTVSGSPALLETLPESPFSWKGRRPENTQPPMVVDKATPACRPASQSSPITPGRLAHAVPNKAAGTDTSEVRVGCVMRCEMDLPGASLLFPGSRGQVQYILRQDGRHIPHVLPRL